MPKKKKTPVRHVDACEEACVHIRGREIDDYVTDFGSRGGSPAYLHDYYAPFKGHRTLDPTLHNNSQTSATASRCLLKAQAPRKDTTGNGGA